MRFRYGFSEEDMGEVRLKEMKKVEKVLKLSGMTVWDLKDGELAHMDPIYLEDLIKEHVELIKPDILVTYAVHGISGHPDHLTTHALVKRIFCEAKRNKNSYLRRLALFTLPREDKDKQDEKGGNFQVNRSKDKYIDCIVNLSEEDRCKFIEALDAYVTFQEVVRQTGVKDTVHYQVFFELFKEDHKPPITDLTKNLPA